VRDGSERRGSRRFASIGGASTICRVHDDAAGVEDALNVNITFIQLVDEDVRF